MPQITTAFAPDLVSTMRWALDAASDRVPVKSRTAATKAKMAQRAVRSAHKSITDALQLVAVAVAEGSARVFNGVAPAPASVWAARIAWVRAGITIAVGGVPGAGFGPLGSLGLTGVRC